MVKTVHICDKCGKKASINSFYKVSITKCITPATFSAPIVNSNIDLCEQCAKEFLDEIFKHS